MPADEVVDHLGPDSSLYSAVIAIAIITMTFAGVCLGATVFYRKSKLMKLTRPMFTCMILTGIILLGIYCILMLGPNNHALCTVRPWLFNLAFTLCFSPLLIKAYMVHLLFNVNPMSKNKLIPSYILFLYTLVFVAVDALLVGLTAYIGGHGTKAETSTELGTNGAYATVTYCSTTKNLVFLSVEVAYKGLLVGGACLLSFLIRKVHGVIAGSKTLIVINYNVACIGGVILLVIHSVKDVRVSIFCQVIGISVSCLVATFMLVVPTLHHLITAGDDEAHEEVMEEVFAQRSKVNEKKGKAEARKIKISKVSGVSGVLSVSPLALNCKRKYLYRQPFYSLPRYQVCCTSVIRIPRDSF